MKPFRSISIFCLAALAVPHSVAAQNYTFTNIADTTGPYSSFIAGGLGGPRLNNNGAVSFVAQLDGGGGGVYRSDGVVTTTIADNSGPLQVFRYSDINDVGQVAYSAESFALGPGNFRGDGLSTTTIIWEKELPFDSERFLDLPITINNAGTVEFYAHGGEGNIGIDSIFVGNGGNISFISDPVDYRAGYGQINNLGTVAFLFEHFGTGSGIGLGTGGTTTTVIDHTGPYSSFSPPSLNDSNVVAALAGHDSGGAYVLRIDGATVDVIAGPYNADIADVGLNNAGDVAFRAELTPSMYTILTGPDPVADKVIGDGDALFGSIVTLLKGNAGDPIIDGPNDAGQIVFRYSLADGRSGIALATPIAGLAGDFNHDGIVCAADYVTWRKNGGTEDDLNLWRANFGQTAGSGAAANSLPATEGVPEPHSLVLLCAAAALLCGARFRRM